MAPEIMQLQKYDAKVIASFVLDFLHIFYISLLPYPTILNSELMAQADLWSVGAIVYQLVTGKTPFTGSNQMQVVVVTCLGYAIVVVLWVLSIFVSRSRELMVPNL